MKARVLITLYCALKKAKFNLPVVQIKGDLYHNQIFPQAISLGLSNVVSNTFTCVEKVRQSAVFCGEGWQSDDRSLD